MRRFILSLLIMLSLAYPLIAQDEPPPTPVPSATLNAMLDQIDDAVDRAQQAAQEAQQAKNEGFELLGLFESFGVIIGLITALVGGTAAVVGGVYLRNIQRATHHLEETRASVQRELEQALIALNANLQDARNELKQESDDNRAEFERLRVDLSDSILKQQENTNNALLAQAILPIGERQYRSQDYLGAYHTYLRALHLDERNPVVHYRLGYIHAQNADFESARDEWERALELDTEFSAARAALGYAHWMLADQMRNDIERDLKYNKAESELLRALMDSPRLIDEDGESWWLAVGDLYLKRNQTEQAIRAYERASEVTLLSSLPYSKLGLLYIRTKNHDAIHTTYRTVEKFSQKAIQVNRNNHWAYSDLVAAYFILKKEGDIWPTVKNCLSTAVPDKSQVCIHLSETILSIRDVVDDELEPLLEEVVTYVQRYEETHDFA